MFFKEIGDKFKCIWFNIENLKENEIYIGIGICVLCLRYYLLIIFLLLLNNGYR